jgi:tetratricopeptide (TPR) repeat protein
MEHKADRPYPEGALSVRRIGRREWEFCYPRLTDEVYDAFHEGIDLWEIGEYAAAEERYRQLVHELPEFIDAHHHLALVLDDTDRREEAYGLWQDTVALGLACLPVALWAGRDRLRWQFLDNRPFLRAYHGLGLAHLERGYVKRALDIFEHILALNPDDNQGVRALAVDCYLRLKRPEEVLALCRRYRGDGMEQLVYGRPLALFQLGCHDEADSALRQAIGSYPKIAEELLKPRHRPPKGLRDDRVTVGGADQAYWYWREQGRLWKRTPGAVEWLRQIRHGIGG